MKILSLFLLICSLVPQSFAKLPYVAKQELVKNILYKKNHPLNQLVRRVAPNVFAPRSGGTAVVLKTNKKGESLFLTATHVFGRDVEQEDYYWNLNDKKAYLYKTLDFQNQRFGDIFYGNRIFSPRLREEPFDYEPRNDFTLGRTKAIKTKISNRKNKIKKGISVKRVKWREEPKEGEHVYAFGHPRTGYNQIKNKYGNRVYDMRVTSGKIIIDEKAAREKALRITMLNPDIHPRLKEKLKESDVLLGFDPSIEFLMVTNKPLVSGNSGGPVFDKRGNLLGILVRAQAGDGQKSYARAIKASWIFSRLKQFFENSILEKDMRFLQKAGLTLDDFFKL